MRDPGGRVPQTVRIVGALSGAEGLSQMLKDTRPSSRSQHLKNTRRISTAKADLRARNLDGAVQNAPTLSNFCLFVSSKVKPPEERLNYSGKAALRRSVVIHQKAANRTDCRALGGSPLHKANLLT